MALEEAFGALVADRGVDVVMRPPSADQVGVLHRWRGSAQHCRGATACTEDEKSQAWLPSGGLGWRGGGLGVWRLSEISCTDVFGL